MSSQLIYDDSHKAELGYALFECVLALLLLSLALGPVSHRLVWQYRVWYQQHHRVNIMHDIVFLTKMIPVWWQSQQNYCLNSCGCTFRPKLVSSKQVRLPRCVNGQLSSVIFLSAPYHGVLGEGLGLYTRLGEVNDEKGASDEGHAGYRQLLFFGSFFKLTDFHISHISAISPRQNGQGFYLFTFTIPGWGPLQVVAG